MQKRWQHGQKVTGLMITANKLKNNCQMRPGTIVLDATTDNSCPVSRLGIWWRQLKQEGELTEGLVFRNFYRVEIPPGGWGGLRSPALANRFRRLAEQVDPQLTVHGIRRERLQVQGDNIAEILQLGGIKTQSVAQMYLDPGRHLPVNVQGREQQARPGS